MKFENCKQTHIILHSPKQNGHVLSVKGFLCDFFHPNIEQIIVNPLTILAHHLPENKGMQMEWFPQDLTRYAKPLCVAARAANSCSFMCSLDDVIRQCVLLPPRSVYSVALDI